MKQPYQIAQQHLGVPFRHRGRSPATENYAGALDCIGLLVVVAKEMGLQVFDQRHYGRQPFEDGLPEALRRHLGPPVRRPMAINDILLITNHPWEEPSHVGLVAPDRHGLAIIHTNARTQRVEQARIDQRMRRQITEVFQWPDKP